MTHLTPSQHKNMNMSVRRELQSISYPAVTGEHVINESSSTRLGFKYNSDTVQLDPDNILSEEMHDTFTSVISEYDNVLSSDISGTVGPFQAIVNMGPVQPPQRKGRVPQYVRDELEELQCKFDDLEHQGVFERPEDVAINVEYLNTSFFVKNPPCGYRLVADVRYYSKPQPSLMPDVQSILRSIGKWKHLYLSLIHI